MSQLGKSKGGASVVVIYICTGGLCLGGWIWWLGRGVGEMGKDVPCG